MLERVYTSMYLFVAQLSLHTFQHHPPAHTPCYPPACLNNIEPDPVNDVDMDSITQSIMSDPDFINSQDIIYPGRSILSDNDSGVCQTQGLDSIRK